MLNRRAWILAACLVPLGASACSDESYIGSICITTWVRNADFNGYMVANGRTLQINQYAALYSLIGVTYGGSPNTNFQIPDLRGRTIIGAGQGAGQPNYPVGQKAGNANITLTLDQMPVHSHTFAANQVPLNLSSLTATTTMSGLTATTSLAGVSGSVSGANLTLNAYNGAGGGSTPNGAALATANTPAARIYASGTPSVEMAAGSIGGSAAVTFGGNATTTLSTPAFTTTLAGSATANVNGTTGNSGTGQAVNILPPYVALPVFIAVQGLYPNFN